VADPVAAAVRAFLERSGATQVTVVVDRGEEPAALIEARDDGTLEGEAGEGVSAPPVPDMRAIAPLRVTRTEEGVDLPLVQLAYLAGHVRDFAAALGGRSVATAHFATSDPERALVIAARPGEPLVVVVGEELYSLPEGWPE
jgi:hypothetical protein